MPAIIPSSAPNFTDPWGRSAFEGRSEMAGPWRCAMDGRLIGSGPLSVRRGHAPDALDVVPLRVSRRSVGTIRLNPLAL